MKIFLNNNILSEDQASISLNDRGLLLGDGLFETIKAEKGRIFFFNQHYARLKTSADILSIPLSYDSHQLLNICQQLLTLNELNRSAAFIRITLTRGASQRSISISSLDTSPTIFITANQFDANQDFYPSVFITSIRRNPESPIIRLKTLNYLEPILARREAQINGFDEGIMLNTKGLISECSVANIFFVKDNKISTPRIENGILPGIVREIVINLCKKNQIPIIEKDISIQEALESEAAFQTNSLIGIQPISRINEKILASNHLPIIQVVKNELSLCHSLK